MRKLLFLFPLLLLPALASAGHNSPLKSAAYHLDASASGFYSRVANLRGNRHLKFEARSFAIASKKFARQVTHNPRSPRLDRALDQLNIAFYELRLAVDYAEVRGNKNRLRRRLGEVRVALNNVGSRVGPRGRLVSNWSRGGYIKAYPVDSGPVHRMRRYRY